MSAAPQTRSYGLFITTSMFAMLSQRPPTPGQTGRSSGGLRFDRRWSATSAGVGTALWLAAPFLPNHALPLGSIEHTFVSMPLIAAPLALLLLSELLADGQAPRPRLQRAAERVQPLAAAAVLASFFLPNGALAGCLTIGWLAMTLLLALSSLRRIKLGPRAKLSNASLLAAQLFLPVGAGWLLLSRLGVGPRSFAAVTVFLAALHFHFSGFTLQILIAATGRRLAEYPSRLGAIHRWLVVGAITGIPLIAAGNAVPSPIMKFLGVATMVLSTIGLAITTAAVGLGSKLPTPRRLLLVSSASIAAGMALAGAYAIGELSGAGWIGVSRMVAVHGQLNALGFTLCGLVGHLLLQMPRTPLRQ